MTPTPETSQAQAAERFDRLRAASRSLRRCQCGSKVVMAYEPGCTFIRCLAERKDVATAPDFSPEQLAGEWNVKTFV